MTFQFSIISAPGSMAGLDVPFPLEPLTRITGPEQVAVSINETPKFGGWQQMQLHWDWLEEADWSVLKVLSGSLNRSGQVYVRAKAEDSLTLVSSALWCDFSGIAVSPTYARMRGETIRDDVNMVIRKLVYVRDSVLTP